MRFKFPTWRDNEADVSSVSPPHLLWWRAHAQIVNFVISLLRSCFLDVTQRFLGRVLRDIQKTDCVTVEIWPLTTDLIPNLSYTLTWHDSLFRMEPFIREALLVLISNLEMNWQSCALNLSSAHPYPKRRGDERSCERGWIFRKLRRKTGALVRALATPKRGLGWNPFRLRRHMWLKNVSSFWFSFVFVSFFTMVLLFSSLTKSQNLICCHFVCFEFRLLCSPQLLLSF